VYCFCSKLFRLGNDPCLFVAKTSITFLNSFGLGLVYNLLHFLSIDKCARKISFSQND